MEVERLVGRRRGGRVDRAKQMQCEICSKSVRISRVRVLMLGLGLQVSELVVVAVVA
jgi:hypothetical protein